MTIGEDAFLAVLGVGGRRRSLAEAVEAGAASASGDAEALSRLKTVFRLPAPRSRTTY